jgi:hypothetical protein
VSARAPQGRRRGRTWLTVTVGLALAASGCSDPGAEDDAVEVGGALLERDETGAVSGPEDADDTRIDPREVVDAQPGSPATADPDRGPDGSDGPADPERHGERPGDGAEGGAGEGSGGDGTAAGAGPDDGSVDAAPGDDGTTGAPGDGTAGAAPGGDGTTSGAAPRDGARAGAEGASTTSGGGSGANPTAPRPGAPTTPPAGPPALVLAAGPGATGDVFGFAAEGVEIMATSREAEPTAALVAHARRGADDRASCVAVLQAPADRGLVAVGQLRVALLLAGRDGQVRTIERQRIDLDVQLGPGETLELPESPPLSFDRDALGEVSCRVVHQPR